MAMVIVDRASSVEGDSSRDQRSEETHQWFEHWLQQASQRREHDTGVHWKGARYLCSANVSEENPAVLVLFIEM